MIRRTLERHLRAIARRWPVVTVTGPRQSGKTTLCRAVFRGKPYVSLEAPDAREHARSDPRGFLGGLAGGALVDEVQHVPALLSYIQEEVDARPAPGRFVLTGSQNLALSEAVSQSLAGRTALAGLLPLSLDELRRFPEAPRDLFATLWSGAYPAVFDRGVPPGEWYADYVGTYLERDVRRVLAVGDLAAFQGFVQLCAGRTAQIVNLSSLGGDAGVSHNTARAWLSALEAGFLVLRLSAYHGHPRKRIVRAPKLHLADSGLACFLLRVRTPEQLRLHPLRGAVFESWVVAEIAKARVHRGLPPDLFHYRDRHGTEVDVVVDRGDALVLVEAKSGETVSSDFFGSLDRVAAALASATARRIERVVVYGGRERQRRGNVVIVPWERVQEYDWCGSI